MAANGYRDRVGLTVSRRTAREAVDFIQAAEKGGVATVWSTMYALGNDLPTLYAAAAVQTDRITLGTSIVPAFSRHPLALAGQALVLENLAPGRLRLGIGTSHSPTMAEAYGLEFGKPLGHLREYVHILKAALNQGEVNFAGDYYQVKAKLTTSTPTPVLTAALSEHAFELAGELADGAISWYCPPSYLLAKAKPAMDRGAQTASRPTPPLLSQINVAFEFDGRNREAVRDEMREYVVGTAGAPFYRQMYAASGNALAADGNPPDALVDELVISGDDDGVRAGLIDLLDQGLDELVVTLVPGPEPAADEARLIAILGGL
jgi:alkanesulfonate monooxygenase SsuD/methylene tetrahydromethanopterin reductase-like flavin-dependent oxidoreductase (luciferase family)